MKRHLQATGSSGPPAQKLKIAFVIDDSLDKTDGVQQYVLALGGWLSAEGHEVHYLAGETRRCDIPRLRSLSRNVQVRFNGNRLSVPLPVPRSKLKTLLAGEDFDVVHVQMPYSPFMAHRLIRQIGTHTALVGTFHIAPYSWTMSALARLLGLWLRPSLKRFDAVMSVSPTAQAFARQTLQLESIIVPNVVDYARFRRTKPLLSRRPDAQKTILFLGRLVPRKGCRLLLEAVVLLRQTGHPLPPYRVLVCGKGPLEAELRQFVQRQRLDEVVEFTGYVPEAEKPRYYASADIAVFPSSGGESFGIVLIEAMAAGRAAVLAGNNPGYASVLAAMPELLFDPTDARELAARLGNLLTNEPARQAMAAWGSKEARRYDTPQVAAKVEAVYGQALRLRRNMR